MDIIQELLSNAPMPRMITIRQKFSCPQIGDIAQEICREISKPGVGDRVRAEMQIAVAVGSRGIANIADIVRATVAELKRRGAKPFVVPAMGSHGGATAEGQKQVLANLGVTEDSAGCPILSSMDIVQIGQLDNGLPILFDRHAYQADGIVVINRVKPHTAFRGPSESGLVKIITIGLGKQKGADSCHAYGFGHMAKNIVDMARVTMTRVPILFGVAVIENAQDKVAKLVGVPAEEIIETDRRLLVEAKANMPRIPFNHIDVLIVDYIGKEFSGDGMDPNITGRYPTPFASGGPKVNKIVVLDLTKESAGNANGIGLADFTTREFVSKINYQYTYANALTSTVTTPVRLPVIMDSDRDAIRAAIKTCNARDLNRARVVRIHDTLHLSEMGISEALLDEARDIEGIVITGESLEMRFNPKGELFR